MSNNTVYRLMSCQAVTSPLRAIIVKYIVQQKFLKNNIVPFFCYIFVSTCVKAYSSILPSRQ